MSHWRQVKFWILWVILLPPSAFGFALIGVIFGEESAFERWAMVILPLQGFVTFAAPYILAKRLASPRPEATQGFPVVQRDSSSQQ